MTDARSDEARQIVERFDAARRPFRALAEQRADADALQRPTASGWTGQEMLGHVGFWEECVEPVLRGLFRGEIDLQGWTFASGFVTGDGWPNEDVHNAREAAWAQGRTAHEVLARWDAAHEAAMAALGTVSSTEATERAEYFKDLVSHLEEHHAELRAS